MEKKAWRDLRLLGQPPLLGTVAGYASVTGTASPSTWDQIITIVSDTPDNQGQLTVAAPVAAPDLHVAIKITPSSDNVTSSALIGYQVRAVPSPRRNELIQVPVLMFDWETDKSGTKYGAVGNAWNRYSDLKDMEILGNPILFKDYTTGESVSAYIEQVAYVRNTPPSNGSGRSGSGGVVTVLLRTV
jgi:hypothetical protein